MRRMLMSSAVALALVAALGVPEASAQKGKEKRKHFPIKMSLTAKNLTTNKSGSSITASAGDEVMITLEVSNYSGEGQTAVVQIDGGVPGNTYSDTVYEYFDPAQTKSASVSGVVPANESGTLVVDVSVLMPKTNDTATRNASVGFNLPGKDVAPADGGRFFERAFARMLVKALIALDDGVSNDTQSVDMTEIKELYR